MTCKEVLRPHSFKLTITGRQRVMAPRKDTARHSPGSSTDGGLQQRKELRASCSAQKSPPRTGNRKQKAKFLLFHSDVGNLPSPSLLFKDLNPTSSQFCKG